MPEHAPWPRRPVALIAHEQEWSARSLESLLTPDGYEVLRAYTGAQALERARSIQPDVIFVADRFADTTGLDVCRGLREGGLILPITPIFMMVSAHPTRQQRIAALRSGVREFLSPPLDAEELLLKLAGYVGAKLEVDRVRHESLLDPASELYSAHGLARRAGELVAGAARQGTPLACVVLGVDTESEGTDAQGRPPWLAAVLSDVADALRRSGRASDAIGRLGSSDFAVFAPATDAQGAGTLAERLADAIEAGRARLGTLTPRLRVHAGYEAVADFRQTPIEPSALVMRATTALRALRAEKDAARVRRYEPRFGMS